MARIPLSAGFALLPKGEQVLRIDNVKYDEDFGKLEIFMVNAQGIKHTERFGLLSSDGTPNEGAMNAFSYFAKTAMNDFGISDINPLDLIGHYLRADVEHDIQPNRNKPGKTVTFVRLGDKSPALGFDNEVVESAPAAADPSDFDLDALLSD